jgi:hypothetical protein
MKNANLGLVVKNGGFAVGFADKDRRVATGEDVGYTRLGVALVPTISSWGRDYPLDTSFNRKTCRSVLLTSD